MDYLSRLPLFVRVVRMGSFAAVAREENMTPSAVSKQIQRLESELKVRLFQRTTRKLSLTDAGQQLFESASPLVEGILEATDALRQDDQRVSGRLKISLPIALMNQGLSDALAEFAHSYPEVRLIAEGNERVVDLLEEGFDLAIRVGALSDSTMIARRLAAAPLWVVSSPGYLASLSLPIAHPDDLAHANLIGYAGHGRNQFEFTRGESRALVQLSGRITGNHDSFLKAMSSRDLGFAVVPAFAVQSEVNDGKLVRLLADWKVEPERSIWAVYPHRQFLPTRTRIFIDFLVAWFDGRPEFVSE